MRREEHALELLDRPMPVADLAATLNDLDYFNDRYGGHWLGVRAVTRRLAGIPRDRRVVVIDVGGGRGDFALRLVAWARKERRRIHVIVLDRDEQTAALARHHCDGAPEISVVRGDATTLPVREGGVDVAISLLTLHHLDVDAAATMLSEMRAAARDALVIVDLPRHPLAWFAVWLTTRLKRCHRITKHDGPLSVRRAYSVPELRELAAKARLSSVSVRRFPAQMRVVMVAS